MGILTTLTYNGKELDPRVFRVEHLPDYTIPQRDLQATHVEGRSGDIVVDSGSYKNIPRSYSISFPAAGPEDFAAKVSEISKWLDVPGYAELYDTYEPEHYRMAYPSGSYKVQSILNGQAGKVTIDFSCIPKRYLVYGKDGLHWSRSFMPPPEPAYSEGDVDGDGYVTTNDAYMAQQAALHFITLTPQQFVAADLDCDGVITNNDVSLIMRMVARGPAETFAIFNPTEYDSIPIFELNIQDNLGSTNEIFISDSLYNVRYSMIHIEIPAHYPSLPEGGFTIVIDCERENVYEKETLENLNSLATVAPFPVLYSHKNNAIDFRGTKIESMTVYPRFWVR